MNKNKVIDIKKIIKEKDDAQYDELAREIIGGMQVYIKAKIDLICSVVGIPQSAVDALANQDPSVIEPELIRYCVKRIGSNKELLKLGGTIEFMAEIDIFLNKLIWNKIEHLEKFINNLKL